ncbi:MAG: hypothetical protein A3G33_06320 [Omnitrophica bacterium RIFCSPLOWO2_12_FULL_44_17]|uniref:Elongation factor P n=1 Tax=Candidatus Danuiimicrobium aquiferis TaxID=1801832 RepID=A0A1G1L1H0_9BACT|nr:MAG: hypothetical protein A3B72_01685 [Omnitrophica bacterium RIFCSPHIGHO2_02_FULL_45_28]OGW89942.1 MAG: hypothetical protein A3E74_03150 [Omnitrophica bacterium RIFCSPHIGHO2_12_FULL_44_12]OGW98992.1 MAG: hypothetical protein A3G33_06320 [Omnitrophica bacterium RIFCSPLOWO2_12_FULL_44_17]OGX04171.1 MAG: hypothetical protein A3J12_03255 [Omnitrophica bacterium RIFCSPLOWO2_02_FULL_44_11]
MIDATEIRVGNILRVDGKICRVLHQEVRGTGKFGKTVHLKLKGLEDGNIHEKSFRAEDKAEDLEAHRVKMQYLYKDNDQYIFMNMETFEQFPIPAKIVGKHEVFLKENAEIDILFGEDRALSIEFPKVAELEVVHAPSQSGDRETFKEVELENGLKVLVPAFVKEGERVRIDVEDFSYMERVTTKSMRTGAVPVEKDKEKDKKKE